MDALRREGCHLLRLQPGLSAESAPDTLRAGELSGPGGAPGGEQSGLSGDGGLHQQRDQAPGGQRRAGGLAVLTDEQTGGRGRRGNTFQSLKGKGLYCSILLRPRLVLDLDKLSTLTAWVAVAASRAVEACCGLRPGIKWTNDLVLGGRKLCGILTELELRPRPGSLPP